MTTHRIEALVDGVFAIAMTLLVLNLALPEMGKGMGLHDLLFGQIDKFVSYAISFILLAIFWIKHHQQSHFIKRTNGKHLWINIFFLMFVALVPFSTSLFDDYSNEPLAHVFFGANILVLAALLTCNWVYATNHHRLIDRDLDPYGIALGKKRGVIAMIVSVLAMGLSFVNPQICSYIYLLIPILQGVSERRYRKVISDTAYKEVS